MTKPPYHPTHNLVTVANTLLARFQTSHTHPPIPELLPMLQSKKKIACLLFDGMGEAILARHLKPEAYLTRQQFIPITSTFPLNLYLTHNNSTLTDPLSIASLPDNFGLSAVPFTVKIPLSLPFKSLTTVGSRNVFAN